MVKKGKINGDVDKGIIKGADKKIKESVCDSKKLGNPVYPEDGLVLRDYRQAGLSESEAWEHVGEYLKGLKEDLEDDGRYGIFGVRPERIARAYDHAQKAKIMEHVSAVKKGKEKGIVLGNRVLGGRYLERQAVTAASVMSIAAGFVFTSPNITGNAIGRVNVIDSSVIGIAFFILGLVGLFLCTKKK